MTPLSTIRRRIRRGSRLLESVMPDYRTRVDPQTLDLADACDCTLGQIYNWYGDGIKALESIEPRVWSAPHLYGFALDEDTGKYDYNEWAVLTAEWRKEITLR